MKTQSQTQERTHFSPIQRSQQQAASGSMSANHHLNTDLDTRMRVMYCVFFLLLVSANVGQAVPVPRMFSSTNNNNKLAEFPPTSAHTRNLLDQIHLPDIIPEEELELESLKGSGASGKNTGYSGAGAVSKKSSSPSSSSSSSTSSDSPGTGSTATTTTTKKPLAYVKKPENEETPALSDNANSLKYGGAHAELEEALANLVHIPPSKSPTLSVSSSASKGEGGAGSVLGESLLQQQHQRKRTRTFPPLSPSGNGMNLFSGGVSNGNSNRNPAGNVNLEVDYSPQDIAEYLFWIGDGRSVELAINDFIQDGLITPQEAVRFLEEVKAELTSLRNRYQGGGGYGGTSPLGYESSGFGGYDDSSIRGFWETPVRSLSKKQSIPNSFNFLPGGSDYADMMTKPSSTYYQHASSSPFRTNSLNTNNNGYGYYSGYNNGNGYPSSSSIEDLIDYEEAVGKLKQTMRQAIADPDLETNNKLREYALEGIIYKLARELFSMGFQHSPGTSVPTFTTFIETLAVNGEIPKDLERAVLETLVQALVDAANEHGLLNGKSSSIPSLKGSSTSVSSSSTAGAAAVAPSALEGQLNRNREKKSIMIKKKKSV